MDWGCLPLCSVLKPIKSGKSVKAEDRPPSESEVGVLKVSAVESGKFLPDASLYRTHNLGILLVSQESNPILDFRDDG